MTGPDSFHTRGRALGAFLRWAGPLLPAGLMCLSACCARVPQATGGAVDSLRVMTFNIRHDEPADRDNAWPGRRDKVAGTIAFFRADVAGLQEVLAPQLRDLERLLPGYGWVGAGRDDGRQAGEFNPVLYLKSRFRVIDSSTFWLSETPDRPSRGWDGACPRVVTWARLMDTRTGSEFTAFNTHFDHVGPRARAESARLLLARAAAIGGDHPAIVTGDFNCGREEEPYRILVSGSGPAPVFEDARDLSRQPPYGSSYSFNGFSTAVPRGGPIDHIFVRGVSSVLRCGVISDFWDGRPASDHFPVFAEVRLASR